MLRVFCFILILFILASCKKNSPQLNSEQYWVEMAEQVIIKRDIYGIPHIYGPTDESVVFGLAYARAEDHFELIENQVIRAIGRKAEIEGESGIQNDYIVRAFQFEKLSRREYQNLSEKHKRIVDAYSAGLNFFLEVNPEIQPKIIKQFKPWHFLALYRRSWTSQGLSQIGVFDDDVNKYLNNAAVEPNEGSNMWAISPKRSGNGKTYLVLNPHIPMDQPYEVHVKSEEGLNFYGELAYGENIFPVLGHNENLGWSLTVNYPDIADRFEITFIDSTLLNTYEYNGELKSAEKWLDTILLKTDSGFEQKVFSFTKTIHGPVLKIKGNKGVSYRVAGIDEGGSMQQFYYMNKASNLSEFKSAISSLSISYHNILYADKNGNIYYVYNGKIPRRDTSFNWTENLNGSLKETLWQGYHKLDELPSLENPEVGFIQNCNTSPFLLTTSDNPNKYDYADYMTIYESENERGERSKVILDTLKNISLTKLGDAIMDTYVHRSAKILPKLFDEYERLKKEHPDRARVIEEPIKMLENWDGYSNTNSEGASLYFIFDEFVHHEFLGKIFPITHPITSEQWPLTSYLAQTVELMIESKGTWRVPWGTINRLQRIENNDNPSVLDSITSYPLKGGSSITGIMFCAYRAPVLVDGNITRRPDAGHSYISIVEFGEETKARSIIPYGISRDSNSPHYFDQAEMFANGTFKKVLYKDEDVDKYLEVEYHPGEKRTLN